MESRYNDKTPVRCEACGWQGRVMDCKHGYSSSGGINPPWGEPVGDVEPMDYCPECGSDNLIPIEQEPATV